MENDKKYLQFPLFILRNLIIDKKNTINNIFLYGIYKFSSQIKYDLSEVARQLMYKYYRSELTNDLSEAMEMYIDNGTIDIDEDYNGFNGSEFNPEIEIEQLMKIFETDSDFKNNAIELHRIKQAYEILGFEPNYVSCMNTAKQIEKSIPEKEPFPMVNKKLLFDFRDNEKSEFDLMQLACYISIQSILGQKSYCPTNKDMIICRAFGYSSIKHLPKEMTPAIKELFCKYMNRYHKDKIIQQLELNWNVLTYCPGMRGFYIGINGKITLDQLVLIAETKKKKNQINELKIKKNEAKEKALQQLNKRQQLNKGNEF